MHPVFSMAAHGSRSLPDVGWYKSILIALPAAVCAYAFGFLMEGPSGQPSSFDYYTYAFIGLSFIVLELLLLKKKMNLHVAVYVIISLICFQFLGKLIFLLYFNPNPAKFHAELTETFFWMPAIYVLGSFVPGVTKGRIITLTFFGLISLVAASYVVNHGLRGENLGIIYTLVELALANTTLLVLIQAFITFKERFTRETSRAELLERLAYTDSLTGLPNRLQLQKTLEHVIKERPYYESVGIVFIDLDGFKHVNDTYGHETGDHLLTAIAKRLRGLSRASDGVFRISGDEFVIVLPGLQTASHVGGVAERVRQALEQPVKAGEWLIPVTASIGVAVCPEDGTLPEDLLRRADAAMYEVKKNGKNGVQCYAHDEGTLAERRVALLRELRATILGDAAGLSLHYQPIYEATGRHVSKVEALLRWNSQTYGAVSPAEFIPIAEEAGLIRKLGTWVLNTACNEAKRWYEGEFTDLKVCVNVSAHQFTQPDFVASVEDALRAAGLPAGCLELELTESVVIHAFERVRDALRSLRRLGVSVALDDFGTGYSSLSYLEELDFDTIKLDRSFAQKLANTSLEPHYAVAIVRAVVEIAAVLDVDVVAEGIETQAQLTTLAALGCTFMQGYYLARPQPASKVTSFFTPLQDQNTLSNQSLLHRLN
jgi:diguanylate cyclase